MDFYSSLTHFDTSTIEGLKSSSLQERTHALILDSSKWGVARFQSVFPNVESHPFLKDVFYYKKETYDFGKLPFYDMGLYSIQDASAMLVPYFLSPNKEDRLLDMCASPGGKTIFASLLMNKEGMIVANDISYARARDLSTNIERMGLGNIAVICEDFTKSYSTFEGFFTKIILDAPCSGSAMFRKDEAARDDWSIEKVHRCAAIQRQLLESAYKMVVPGGIIAYSTCSFSGEENEDNILTFLETHNDIELLNIPDFPGVYRCKTLHNAIYLLPHLYQGEGQFIALLKKKGEIEEIASIKSKPVILPNELSSLLDTYHIQNLIYRKSKDTYYGSLFPLDDHGLHLLRFGTELGSYIKHFEPGHHLAKIIPNALSLPLSAQQASQYLKGESFPLSIPNGYHVVSYMDMNLGWVKVVDGVAKNHYPKGLRRNYQL